MEIWRKKFTYGDLEKEIYIQRPESFVVTGKEKKVYKLVMSLCGLKQVLK